jgi:hypothetical protein
MHIHDTNKNKKPMTTIRPRSITLNLINEVLSRARMRGPQNVSSEARRPARRIAIEARRRLAREVGDLSQFGIH